MTTDSTIVEVSHVTKRFVLRKEKSLKERLVNFGRSNLHKEDFFALRDVNLTIEAGTTVGLIGPNGSGKSTLLKTIGGIIQPTSGTVKRRGRMAALLELGAGFHPDLTGRENVYLNAAILGLTRAETDLYFDDIIEFSGIAEFIDTQVKFYSSGMYVRLAFAVAVHVNPDILIIDEVLAVGDEPFQRKCLDRVRQFQDEGKTIVLVSHSLEQVAELCSRVVVLVHGQVTFDGKPADGVRALREGFESVKQQQVEQREAAGKPVATITSAEVRPSSRKLAPTDFETLSDIYVDVEINAESEIHNLSCELEIETPLGHRVFATNSIDLGLKIPAKVGNHKVSFLLPRVSLGSGTYLINLALSTHSEGEITRDSHIAHFAIIAPREYTGTTFIEAKASSSAQSRKKKS
ncbi:ABC transporter ATP-binding protein [Aurantimicrobium minutum]|uniref:ABC transporter ATP-binding protein n=1 Tax=Aurantimicrobium minutum TaxID=708131 RepID=UPI002475EE2D|nr:ABC transporter ATP-binding protein [Aurantimicrobium minutum]MDH6208382.1 ABC-2 type transport system ATP-binding protein [Aurantimicrobium minutum]